MAKKAKKNPAAKTASSEAGPVNHIVQVDANTEHFRLRVMEPKILAKPGDTIIWVFQNIPEGWLPWIEFPEQPPYGPFSNLTVTAVAVWGTLPEDGSGEARLFPYQAVIRTGLGLRQNTYGALLRSPLATLQIKDLEPANLEVTVSYHAAAGELVLSPKLIKRNPGDTVEWTFDIPPDVIDSGTWRPRIDFFRFDGGPHSEPANLSLGPFTSLAQGLTTVVGMGKGPNPGIYSYTALAVQRDTGSVQLKSTPDPVIDDRGEPIDLSGDPG